MPEAGQAVAHKKPRRDADEFLRQRRFAASETVEQALDGYRRFQLLKTAHASGLFSWLDENGPASAHRIVDAMHWSPRHGQLFLDALLEEDFLEQKGNRLQLAIPPIVQRRQLQELEQGWENFPALLSGSDAGYKNDSELHRLWSGGEFESAQVISALRARPQERLAGRLIDLGGTDGAICMAICHAFPDMHCDLLVEPERRASLQSAIAQAGHSQRINLLNGNLVECEWLGTYDVVLAAHCFYGQAQAILQVMESIAAHLRGGGLFVSLHGFEEGQQAADANSMVQLERLISGTRLPLHYPLAYADRISSAGMQMLDCHSWPEGEYATCLHVAQRIVG